MCLADAVLAIAPQHVLKPVIAHLDHGLRGEASHNDAEFVRAFAQSRSMPCVIEHADVQAHAKAHAVSIEVAARDVRSSRSLFSVAIGANYRRRNQRFADAGNPFVYPSAY